MNIDEIVRTSMEELAHDLQPTLPDPAAVRARVNRGRRIRAIATIGVAAVVAAAVVLGVAELRDDTRSAPPVIGPVDVGTPVWMAGGVLHIGDQEFPQEKAIDTALVPVKSGAVYGAPGGEIVYQPLDGPAQIIGTDTEVQPPAAPKPGPAADPDSDLVAVLRWSTDDGRYDLYLYDAARGRQRGTGMPVGGDNFGVPGDHNPFGDTRISPVEWIGATDDGGSTWYFRNGQDLWLHNSEYGLAPIGKMPLDVTLDVFAGVAADGRLTFTTASGLQHPGRPLSSVSGVEADGGLSHDGVYYAGSNADPDIPGAIAVVDTHTGETRDIDAPEGSGAPLHLSWAAGHTLMFLAPDSDDAGSDSGSVVACNADTLECVDVEDVADIDTVVLPRL
jgi:hypothetical protein